jgi:hypothetical protein
MSHDLYHNDSDVEFDDEPLSDSPPVHKVIKPAKSARGKGAAAKPASTSSSASADHTARNAARHAEIASRTARIAAKRAEIASRKAAKSDDDIKEVSVVRDKVYICYGIQLTTAPSTYKPAELESFGIKHERSEIGTLYYTILDEFETEPAGIRKIPGDLAVLLKYQGLFGMIYHASPLSVKKTHATQWHTDNYSPFYFVKY